METDISEVAKKSLTHEVYIAARDGQGVYLFEILLATNQDTVIQEVLSYRTEDGEQNTTPLIIAARNGREKVLNVLLNRFCVDIEQTGTVKFDKQKIRGATPLWCAAAAGYFDIVRLLVEHGANVNHQTQSGSTPVRAACYNGYLDIVTYLVAHGADIHIANKWKNNCLMISCYKGHYQIVEYLIDEGADLYSKDQWGSTVLHHSAEAGHFMIVKLLVESGMTITTRNDDRITPLMIAAVHGRADVVKYLTALPECRKEDKIEALELLATSFTDCGNYNTSKAYYYLKKAIKERHADTKDMVLKAPLTPVPVYDNKVECQTVMELEELRNDDLAIQMEALTIRERILGPENPEVPDTVIYAGAVFADNGRYDKCIDLWIYALKLSQKIDKSFAVDRFPEMFDDLIRLGINFEFETILQVFDYAIKEIDLDKTRLEKGNEDPDSLLEKYQENIVAGICLVSIMLRMDKTEKNTFELHRAVYKFVQQKTRLANGFTLLHICCDTDTRLDNVDFHNVTFPDAILCQTLVACGAEVNAQDNRKNTPLHIIAKCGDAADIDAVVDIIVGLTEHGAHIDICNLDGESAMNVAATDLAQTIIRTQSRIVLKCLAAKAVKRYAIMYKDVIPVYLQNFVELH